MGEVYEAEDKELDERVALKTARLDGSQTAQEIERFRREIQLARRVTHANVCRTFDVFRHIANSPGGDSSEIVLISMELLLGQTLHERIVTAGQFHTSQALPLVEQLCAGLGAAHQVGVVHRDFKSKNVMLVSPGSSTPPGRQSDFGAYRAVITDFGLAHAEAHDGGTLTRIGDFLGTPAYMAPEQLDGGLITPATDVYALGIVIYEMLTGLLPFSADTPLAAALKRLTEPAPSPRVHVPDLDPKWEITVARCLERLPERRFANTADIVRALRGESVAISTAAEPRAVTANAGPANTAAKAAGWEKPFRGGPLPAVLTVMAIALGFFALLELRHRTSQKMSENDHPTAIRQQASGARKSIAILGFQNLSGRKDADLLGNVLGDSLWSQLDAGQLRFIPASRVEEMKQNLDLRNLPGALTKEQIERIYKYLGADVLVTGSYTVSGNGANRSIQWNIHLLNCDGGASLGSVSQSGTESDLNGLAIHSGRLVRQVLGVNVSAEEESRMDGSLSSNAEATRDYSEARRKLETFDILTATKLLEKSVQADPQFAQAHSTLAESWDALGFESKAADEAKRALDAQRGLSPEARIRVTAEYYVAMRDWKKAIQEYAQLWAEYRDEAEYGISLANTQIRAGRAKDALTTIGQVYNQPLAPGIRAQADLAEAQAYGDLGDYKQELSIAASAAQTAQTAGATLLLARARILQCFANISLGDAQKARPLCEEAKTINLSAGDELGAARATNDIANAYYYAGNYTAAEPLYQQALSISQTIGDAYDEAGALNNLANIESARGDHVAAVKTYEQAIALARERNAAGDAALAEQNMAIDLYAEGDFARGSQMFSAALKASRDLGDRNLEARILNNKCATALTGGALAEARNSCEHSLKIRREINDRAGIGKTLASFGNVQLYEGDLAGSQRSLEESLTGLETVNAESDAAYTRISLAQLALEERNPDAAGKYAGYAASEFAAEKDSAGEAEARMLLARAMLASRNVVGAHDEIETATRLAQQSGDRGVKLDAAIVAALVDAKLGKNESALKSLQLAQKDARAEGLIETAYDARLALGEIQMTSGRKNDGRVTLQHLAVNAGAHGFKLIARKALAASRD